MTSIKRKKYVISSLLVTLLLLVTITSARVDLNSYDIDLSNKNLLRHIFYDSAGNDSTLLFDSDTHGETRMKINGTTGMVNITENLTIESFTIAGFVKNLVNGKLTGGNSIVIGDISVIGDGRWLRLSGANANQDIDINDYTFTASSLFGDGGNLTNISAGTTFNFSDWFNQQLNTTNNATFTWLDIVNGINASYFSGDGGNLTNISGTFNFSHWFDQTLNTTNNVSFWNVTATKFFIGNGSLLTGIVDKDTTYSNGAGLNLTGTVFSFNGSVFNQNLTWDSFYLNATDTDTTYINGVGINLTGTIFSFNVTWGDSRYSLIGHKHQFNYSGYNQNLNTTNNVTFWNITSSGWFIGNGSLLTGLSIFTFSDWFDQTLNITDNVVFNRITSTFVGDGGNLTNLSGVWSQYDANTVVLNDVTDNVSIGGNAPTDYKLFIDGDMLIDNTTDASNNGTIWFGDGGCYIRRVKADDAFEIRGNDTDTIYLTNWSKVNIQSLATLYFKAPSKIEFISGSNSLTIKPTYLEILSGFNAMNDINVSKTLRVNNISAQGDDKISVNSNTSITENLTISNNLNVSGETHVNDTIYVSLANGSSAMVVTGTQGNSGDWEMFHAGVEIYPSNDWTEFTLYEGEMDLRGSKINTDMNVFKASGGSAIGGHIDDYNCFLAYPSLHAGLFNDIIGFHYQPFGNGATIGNEYGLLVENVQNGNTSYAIKTKAGIVDFGDNICHNNHSLLYSNLSTYAGDNINWDGINMKFNGTSSGGGGGNPFNQDLNTTNNATFTYIDILNDANITGDLKVTENITCTHNITAYNYTANGFFIGDGSLLTGLPSGFTYSDWFNQHLNTTNNVTFTYIDALEDVNVTENLTVTHNITAYNYTANGFFIGDGSQLTNIPSGGNIFNQDLNTTNNATFTYLDILNDANFTGNVSMLENLTVTKNITAYNVTVRNIEDAYRINFFNNRVCIGNDATIAINNDAIAIGDGAIATGSQSVAIGENAKAMNTYCCAIGKEAVASGFLGSCAVAYGANASAIGGFALGPLSKVFANFGIAVGNNARASGQWGFAFGPSSVTWNLCGIAIGYAANVSADYGIALGRSTIAANPNTMEIGNPTYPLSVNISKNLNVTNNANVSGYALEGNTYYYAYNSTGHLKLTTSWTNIPWDTEVRNDSLYSLIGSCANITVSESGWYKITADVAANCTGTTRGSADWRIIKNGVEIDGSRAASYHRTTLDGRQTSSITLIVYAEAGEGFIVQGKIINALLNVWTLPDGCRVTVERI